MDFACKTIEAKQVLKCALGLSTSGCEVLKELLNTKQALTSEHLATATGYDLATVQRNLKHLHEREVLMRTQHNREGGGYEYLYEAKKDTEIIKTVNEVITEWMRRADTELREHLNDL